MSLAESTKYAVAARQKSDSGCIEKAGDVDHGVEEQCSGIDTDTGTDGVSETQMDGQQEADIDAGAEADIVSSSNGSDTGLDGSSPQPPQPQPQEQSLLLSKLSPELRLMIWERVLGGMRLHIIQRSRRRLGYIVCPQTLLCEICQGGLPQPVRDGCRSLALAWNWKDSPDNNRNKATDLSLGGSGLLALPMTCRQM